MASPAQILANRENSKLSSGPKTREGQEASSRNATRHGLTGAQIVISGENASEYENLREGMRRSYHPANEAELVLVEQIAANAWRLMRAQRVEAAFLAKITEDAEDPDAAIALAFLEKSKEMARMHRYVTAAQNAYYKAIAQLSKLQKERAMLQPSIEEVPISQLSNSIGFVSYDADEPRIESPLPGNSAQFSSARDNINP